MSENSWFALYPIPLLLFTGALATHLAGMGWAEGAMWGAAFGVGIWVAQLGRESVEMKMEVPP